MFDGRWRDAVDRTTRPVGRTLQRRGVTADVLTGTGLVSALGTAVAVASGHLLVAVFLLILTGMHDLFDGPVAKASGTASVRGAFFDSVTDRVADAVLLGGVAWYLASRHHGQTAVLPLAVLGVTALVSYERAKAEALGLSSARGGLMERAERLILLGVGFLVPWLLVPVLWALLGLTSVTAAGRFVRVWKEAEGPPARPAAAPVLGRRAAAAAAAAAAGSGAGSGAGTRWRPGRVESRWRAWREARDAREALAAASAAGAGAGAGGIGTAGRPVEEIAGRRAVVGRAGEPLGRWRARRQESPASRSRRARGDRRGRPERAERPERAVRSARGAAGVRRSSLTGWSSPRHGAPGGRRD